MKKESAENKNGRKSAAPISETTWNGSSPHEPADG